MCCILLLLHLFDCSAILNANKLKSSRRVGGIGLMHISYIGLNLNFKVPCFVNILTVSLIVVQESNAFYWMF